MINKNTPLGVSHSYNPETKKHELTWSYVEDNDIDYFQVEYYDENKRAWVPYDGRNGIIKKE